METRKIRHTRGFAASWWTLVVLAAIAAPQAFSQEGFGFGDPEAPPESESTAIVPSAVGTIGGAVVGGKLEYDTTAFFDPADGEDSLFGSATGRLDFSAKGSSVEASIKLKINEKILTESPANLVDEAAVRMYAGKLDLEGGLLKVSWGKADSQGPLDVLNPLDLTDLTVTDARDRKIAQPMLRAAYALGSFSKLEAAFLPGFEGNRIAWAGPWTPASVSALKTQGYAMLYYGTDPTANGGLGNGLYNSYYASAWYAAYATAYNQYLSAHPGDSAGAAAAALPAANAAVAANATAIAAQADAAANDKLEDILEYPETRSLEYAQGGLRFTTTVGSVDFGLQYFTGFLPNPVISMDAADIVANGYRAEVAYNRYHQAGADAAAVIAGFNFRAELAADLTDDLEGDDPEVYNPAVLWSIGFDRDVVSNVNLNLQYHGSYRLFDEGVGDEPYDIEEGTDLTRTKITAVLSQKLFNDTVEWELKGLYGIEDRDYLFLPKIGYVLGDGRIDLSAGIFGGEEDGELGQFDENDYCRLTLSYRF